MSLKVILQFVKKWVRNRYVYTSLLFLLWLSFLDDTSFVRQYRRSQELHNLLTLKEMYEREAKTLSKKIADFENNIDVVVRYGREHYKMKKENEDIFTVVDNN